MADRHCVLIDGTLESQVDFFAQSPIFQPWLRSYKNIPEALQFITEKTSPYSVQVYMARDNLLDDVLSSSPNGRTRTLIDTFCELRTIHHVSIYCPNVNIELEQQIRRTIADPRLIKQVLPVIDLHSYMCKEGEQYFKEAIWRCKRPDETKFTQIYQQHIDDLMDYRKKVQDDQRRLLQERIEQDASETAEQPS